MFASLFIFILFSHCGNIALLMPRFPDPQREPEDLNSITSDIFIVSNYYRTYYKPVCQRKWNEQDLNLRISPLYRGVCSKNLDNQIPSSPSSLKTSPNHQARFSTHPRNHPCLVLLAYPPVIKRCTHACSLFVQSNPYPSQQDTSWSNPGLSIQLIGNSAYRAGIKPF